MQTRKIKRYTAPPARSVPLAHARKLPRDRKLRFVLELPALVLDSDDAAATAAVAAEGAAEGVGRRRSARRGGSVR